MIDPQLLGTQLLLERLHGEFGLLFGNADWLQVFVSSVDDFVFLIFRKRVLVLFRIHLIYVL